MTSKLFTQLGLWADATARTGPEQMACDEALLGCASKPVLRIFRWAAPWVSAGYFTPLEKAAAVRPDLPVCRRWTGGGVVVHDGDFTFTLAVPRGEPWVVMRPADSYRVLHEAVTRALRAQGVEALLSGGEATGNDQCFASPVAHDIMSGARKIVGGAQRRTKSGLLHQGSIQLRALPPDFARVLASQLADTVEVWTPPADFEDKIAALCRAKYSSEGFTHLPTGR